MTNYYNQANFHNKAIVTDGAKGDTNGKSTVTSHAQPPLRWPQRHSSSWSLQKMKFRGNVGGSFHF